LLLRLLALDGELLEELVELWLLWLLEESDDAELGDELDVLLWLDGLLLLDELDELAEL